MGFHVGAEHDAHFVWHRGTDSTRDSPFWDVVPHSAHFCHSTRDGRFGEGAVPRQTRFVG